MISRWGIADRDNPHGAEAESAGELLYFEMPR
jgi:hypothetical protein